MRLKKFRQLFEQHLNLNHGSSAAAYTFTKQFRQLLGISEGVDPRTGSKYIDLAKREVNPRDINVQEMFMGILGQDWQDNLKEKMHFVQRFNIGEANGLSVLPSHFSNISAATASLSGLIEAIVYEPYDKAELVGMSLVKSQQRRTNGGRAIRATGQGGTDDPLQQNEPFPSVGAGEDWATIPVNERFGRFGEIAETAIIYDQTGQIQEVADTARYAVQRSREIRIADMMLGVTNPYIRQDVANDTYQAAAAAAPHDYVNSSTNELVNATDVDNAVQVMEGNTDPATGFEITVVKPNWQVAVMPQAGQNARTIMWANVVERRTESSAWNALIPAEKLLPGFGLIELPRLWYNRLVAAGVSTTNAVARWHLWNGPKAFGYNILIPYGYDTVEPDSDMKRREIAMAFIVREHGVPWVMEPRYAYQGTKE